MIVPHIVAPFTLALHLLVERKIPENDEKTFAAKKSSQPQLDGSKGLNVAQNRFRRGGNS